MSEVSLANVNTLAQAVEVAKTLRKEADDASRKFMDFMVAFEARTDLWSDTGMTFIQIIEHYSIVKPGRYTAYKKGLLLCEQAAPELTKIVGVNAIIAAANPKLHPEKRKDYLGQVVAWGNNNGTAISEQSAKQIVRDYGQRELGRTHHKSYAELVDENAHLRKQLAERDQTIADLRVENVSLRRSVRPARKGPLKASSEARSHRTKRMA